jgi:class 3 adenylate cyclase
VAYGERVYRWEWRLRSSPERFWPLIADTNRFNRDVGLGGVEAQPTVDGRRRVRLGRLVEWEEEPFEWERPRRFSVRRRFLRGPVAELRVVAELEPQDGGTDLAYEVRAVPRNLLGALAIPIQIGRRSARRFDETIRRYDEEASSTAQAPAAPRSQLTAGGKQRLDRSSKALIDEGQEPQLVRQLAETIENGDDLELAHMRPYRLADRWGADRRAVLELCLRATRAGVLDLHWDLLCPLCRGPQESTSRLVDVDPNVHCESCGIDFRADFERSVELTFRPSPAMREVEVLQYCVGGPQVTPHIVLQQHLGPREERAVRVPLETGAYRLRLRGRGGSTPLRAEGGETEVRLANPSDDEAVALLERTAWADDAVTAAEVTALQVFRDLFVNEVVRPGEPVSVGTLAVLFTDLLGSTRYYRQVGDAPAFASVRDHLQVMHDVVAETEGAVVKTMGDAVMAVFRRPVAAVQAVLRAYDELGGRPLALKAGLHYGPVIAVNQNDRLDYFGSTVNAAARLVDLSAGGLILSGTIHADPEVQELLAGASLEALTAELKGFDEERFELFRLSKR